jgi:hypothetical protein
MARAGQRKATAKRRQAPREQAPLPPATRTIGQLVAETVRTYAARFAPSVALGLPIAVANALAFERAEVHGAVATGHALRIGLILLAMAPFATLAYAWACVIVTAVHPPRRSWAIALAAGTLVFLPAAFLAGWFALAAVAWLAVWGPVVPAAMLEGRSFTGAFRRAWEVARADLVHAIGGLAALAVVFGLTERVLAFVLRSQADNALRASLFLADLVLSPLLFLGGVLVYQDLAARVVSPGRRPRRNDADLSDADHAHREGRADPQVQSGPPA